MNLSLVDWKLSLWFLISLQESLLKFGKETLSHKSNKIRREEIVKQLGQTGLVLGVFAAAAFAVKHIFV